jgi:mannose-6-phosphate isomerase-like protein (cupin superfamily)
MDFIHLHVLPYPDPNCCLRQINKTWRFRANLPRKEIESMDLDTYKNRIITNAYHMDIERVVPMHNHPKYDEVFYCIKGKGLGVLEDSEVELEPGKAFIVPAGIMHTIKTKQDLFVCSFQIPPVDDDSP